MALNTLFNKLFPKTDEIVEPQYDNDELNFVFRTTQFKDILNNKAPSRVAMQFTALQSLVEEDRAEKMPDGFIVNKINAIKIADDELEIYNLPPRWMGAIKANIKSTTTQKNFGVELSVADNSSDYSHVYSLEGPTIKFGENTRYLLTQQQFRVFNAIEIYDASNKAEYDKLSLLSVLQQAQTDGCNLHLGHFNRLQINVPDKIAIEVKRDKQGNLMLSPALKDGPSFDKMQRVLGQLRHGNSTSSLRVDKQIILFDEVKLKAVKEILNNRFIPKERVAEFLKSPSAFIDATLVDLDLGFSIRVHGATVFEHAYFGDIEQTEIDWFAQLEQDTPPIDISVLDKHISDSETLAKFKQNFEDATQTNAEVMTFDGDKFDISEPQIVEEKIDSIEKQLSLDENQDIGEQATSEEQVHVVDVELLDEQVPDWLPEVTESITQAAYSGDLEWSNHARKPYDHQETGIRWVIGLAANEDKRKQYNGALLADDMGLGKTFMALSAIEYLYQLAELANAVKKPALIVAPLSLLENWQDELDKTFIKSPFDDVIILQSASDLSRFKEGDIEISNQLHLVKDEHAPDEDINVEQEQDLKLRYSLKVGKSFGNERLDMPARLVITTYQTLRNYQFSMCLIDWGMVVFDEAQNIKNPNTLQTRAAKGLKADFKLLTTGTPVENSLADFWCLVDTASPGLLGSYQSFRQTYITPIIQAPPEQTAKVKLEIGGQLRASVGALMLRRLKEDCIEGLPNKYMYIGVKSSVWQYKPELSAEMKNAQLDDYDKVVGQHSQHGSVYKTLRRVNYASLHPQLLSNSDIEIPQTAKAIQSLINESAKMQSLITVLDQIKVLEEKCIIFAMTKRLQRFLSLILSNMYKLSPITIINGDTKAAPTKGGGGTRKSLIADFEAQQGFNIIIMSPVAAGVGLTVVGANHVIHYERHWNPAKEAQATDRVYRIGQSKDVHIHVPILHHPKIDSFDVNLNRLLEKKTQLKEAVVTPDIVKETALIAGMLGKT